MMIMLSVFVYLWMYSITFSGCWQTSITLNTVTTSYIHISFSSTILYPFPLNIFWKDRDGSWQYISPTNDSNFSVIEPLPAQISRRFFFFFPMSFFAKTSSSRNVLYHSNPMI